MVVALELHREGIREISEDVAMPVEVMSSRVFFRKRVDNIAEFGTEQVQAHFTDAIEKHPS